MSIDPKLREGLAQLPTSTGIQRSTLESAGLVSDQSVSGLLSSFDVFGRVGFPSERIDPAVRAFYEESTGMVLEVRPHWQGVIGASYKLLRPVLRRLGQIDFPTRRRWEEIEGELIKLETDGLGPECVAWLRRWKSSGARTMYAAIHSTHESRGRTYMDFSLPMLGGVLTVSLRLDALDTGGESRALALTSFPQDDHDDTGTWFVREGRALPIPIRERITVWESHMAGIPEELARDRSGATALAQHHFFMFGIRFLTLHYRITHPA